MKMIIDRFESEYAVVELENGVMANMPKILLPNDATEGSVINIVCESQETENRRNEMKKKMNNIFRKE